MHFLTVFLFCSACICGCVVELLILPSESLPETIIDGRRYRASTIRATAKKAYQMCKEVGMELVSIPNQERNDILVGLMEASFRYVVPKYWTSGRRIENDKWVWGNGQPFNYTNWQYTEPNNAYPPEDCVHLHLNGEWNDIRCIDELYFICEAPENFETPESSEAPESSETAESSENSETSESPKTDATCTCKPQPIIKVYVNYNPDSDPSSWKEASQASARVDVITSENGSPYEYN